MRCTYFGAVHKPGQSLRWDSLKCGSPPLINLSASLYPLLAYKKRCCAWVGGRHRLFPFFSICYPSFSNIFNLLPSTSTFLLAAFYLFIYFLSWKMSKKEPIWGRRVGRLFQAEGTVWVRAFGRKEYTDPWWLERPVLLDGMMGWGSQGQTIPSPVLSSLVLLKALGGHKGIVAVMVQ